MRKVCLQLLFLIVPVSLAAQPVDVCVYGGTSAGVMAAVSAKRLGKSVLLIEPGRHLGGLSSGGLGATDIGNKFAVTGLARDFYRRIGAHYGHLEQWTFEPHVAETIFNTYLREANLNPVMEHRLVSVMKAGNRLTGIVVEPSNSPGNRQTTTKTIYAKQFIDCSYEGDLMAKAGVTYTVGREANSQYGETWNGVQFLDKHQFPDGVDPYNVPGKPESGLLWGVTTETLAARGAGDHKIQAYNYRMCLTDDPANRVPISRPARYDSSKYELLVRQIQQKTPGELTWNLMHFVAMPNRKTDINNCGGLSTDMIGANWTYPDADYNQRAQIVRDHEDYTKGLFYFIGHDPRVPKHLRDEMLRWGYPKDEYPDNDHFSHQLYIREARRMVGDYVMTQANCEGKAIVSDGIGMAAYTMDSHNCQRLVVIQASGKAMVRNEGDVQVGGFPPYPISYRALVPKSGQVRNLLVPVCLSASHIAYGSIRMEPVFMVLGQTAGAAAAQAIDQQVSVQSINVAQLQRTLRENPLLDGSRPELLIDDDDSLRVSRRGSWQQLTKGSQYGKAALFSQDKQATVTFRATGLKPGRYQILCYNPTRRGGGGNPDQVAHQADKASAVTVRVLDGTVNKTVLINQQKQNNDWISLGTFLFTAGTAPSVSLEVTGSTEPVVADAVLFLPIHD
ncbi:FAD-dependent oxidoreductase [Fibrella forsythiae]|uniref:FAD-dependent oxidoreductase n=1 Tax=Fibrella forsythiae TaxID=2817061 RepID=A0ABS3JFS7_9BACT|nr:FAD-dependent oxidoreductase [Fibrella forsythiae]MBO0948852.1 FAD-dependent oxidoreductase [Fibrella forsythiae]